MNFLVLKSKLNIVGNQEIKYKSYAFIKPQDYSIISFLFNKLCHDITSPTLAITQKNLPL